MGKVSINGHFNRKKNEKPLYLGGTVVVADQIIYHFSGVRQYSHVMRSVSAYFSSTNVGEIRRSYNPLNNQ